jgi:hypothetical protein
MNSNRPLCRIHAMKLYVARHQSNPQNQILASSSNQILKNQIFASSSNQILKNQILASSSNQILKNQIFVSSSNQILKNQIFVSSINQILKLFVPLPFFGLKNMKNGFYFSLFILTLGVFCHFGLPWWAIVIIAGIGAILFPQRPTASFALAFGAGTLLWYGSAFISNLLNEGLLASKIGQLFLGLKGFHLLMITGMLGGTLAGMGAITGTFLRQLFANRRPTRYRGKRPTYKI